VHRGRYTLLPARRRHVGLRRVCPKNRERYNSTVLPLSDALVSNIARTWFFAGRTRLHELKSGAD
jgi:hypothetical protein